MLGEHVEQAGSYVDEKRGRLDFTHFSAMTPEELTRVERMVNEQILSGLPVDVRMMPIDEARASGAMALFSEKYGDVVRVVSMGDFSRELCGGTHLTDTSRMGLFKIVSESSVAAGVRRIECVTGIRRARTARHGGLHPSAGGPHPQVEHGRSRGSRGRAAAADCP